MMYGIQRSGGCGWNGADKAGRRTEGGMKSDHECNQACKRLGNGCQYAAFSEGYCHLFKTCTGTEGGSVWKTYKKRCSHSEEMNALAEEWLHGAEEVTGDDVATYAFA